MLRTPMRALVVLGGLSAAVVGAAGAQPPAIVVPAPVHDFGAVAQGETVTHAFPVRNDGPTPIVLGGVEFTTPGMTAAFRRVIPPDQSGRITITWETRALTGEVEGEALVHLAGASRPAATLVLKGVVRAPVDVLPRAAAFFSLFQGERAERIIHVVNNESRPFLITGLEPQGRHFAASLETVEVGRRYLVRLTVPGDVPPGRYRERLQLKTDRPGRPRLSIDVNVLVKPDVYASPELIDFGRVSVNGGPPGGAPTVVSQSFLVKRRGGPFRIRSIACDLPALTVRESPDGASDMFRIDVDLATDELTAGDIAGSIRIVTDDGRFPEIVVPVRGMAGHGH